MTTIKDSVHDHIEISDVAEALLDTPPVQRLRRIKQLGTVHLVYPSANHTRFEHSLGVYHLADRALEHVEVSGTQAERVRAAAILHDIGHGPFSHNVEDVIHRYTGKYHDDVVSLVTAGRVAETLEQHGLDPEAVAALIRGEGELAQLIAGELDVDRMDYLVRDAHHTGVPYGTIDHGRLVRELTFVDGELVLDEGNVQTAESLLLARALMNPTVYSHHVARISKSMLRRSTDLLLKTSEITATQLRRMDDSELSVALRTHDTTNELGNRIAERDLYKRAVWAEMGDVKESVLDADHETIGEFECAIADEVGIPEDAVILDIPGRSEIRESTTRVLVNGEIRSLGEQSTLVRALRVAQREQWRLGVYAPADHAEHVGFAAERILGLETNGALVSEINSPGRYASLDEF